MSLIESVLSSIVTALFLSIFVGVALTFVSLKQKVDAMNFEYNRDYFLTKTFEKLTSDEIQNWKTTCEVLYPKTKIEVQKVGVKENETLYVSRWNGKCAYLKLKEVNGIEK